ncbi:MAG: hypothetical protein KAX49_02105 [Halanaerobiales bacterium]|nr:hypothetical protein [Halanaerobiales bacterium]
MRIGNAKILLTNMHYYYLVVQKKRENGKGNIQRLIGYKSKKRLIGLMNYILN